MIDRPLTRIVMADDDDEFLAFLSHAFSDDPYELHLARNGREALNLASRYRPSLVVLDVNMPEMDGYEVCRQLKSRAETREIPVLLVTARSGEQDILKGFQEGADDFLSKPFSVAYLKAKIRTWLMRGGKNDT
jgi:DNA-binding response OmpR family regulator